MTEKELESIEVDLRGCEGFRKALSGVLIREVLYNEGAHILKVLDSVPVLIVEVRELQAVLSDVREERLYAMGVEEGELRRIALIGLLMDARRELIRADTLVNYRLDYKVLDEIENALR